MRYWPCGIRPASASLPAATGSQALAALRGMASHADGSVWRGPAADAFGVHLAQTPGQLQQMVTSYETAGEAMRAFGARARPIDAVRPRSRISPAALSGSR